MKPKAVMQVRPDKIARVCYQCPDKEQAHEWCESRGYEMSHGLCPECYKKELLKVDVFLAEQKAKKQKLKTAAPDQREAAVKFCNAINEWLARNA